MKLASEAIAEGMEAYRQGSQMNANPYEYLYEKDTHDEVTVTTLTKFGRLSTKRIRVRIALCYWHLWATGWNLAEVLAGR